ncbi:FkbM family methyltransferase [Microvirga tunisiensis]|uniref:FkbM family methyltransferase n=1 Tax=Pannonibacter tanglangensis TaxID=2750084 RepID=A0A7X5EYZ5_9HYPH|nr:FkbM family methyltransferase [Pannonibacter sp. XCT-53]NBN76718.1 FkbM family methyltransferase [Pannonibacter sp. XCT-53]
MTATAETLPAGAAARLKTALGVARSLVIYYGQPWRRAALKRFYRDLVAPGDLVFDIGAHVGSRSQTLLSLGARVVAVEPQPAFAALLDRHLASRLVALERVAVGAEEGEVTLRISSRHPTVTTVSDRFIDGVRDTDGFREVVWDQAITLPMTTLDRLIASHGLPAFCKIDVEGAEADILRGLSQPVALIAFEYIPAMPAITREAVTRLMQLGPYRFNRVIGETHRFVSSGWVDAEALLAGLDALPPDAPSGDVYARLAA